MAKFEIAWDVLKGVAKYRQVYEAESFGQARIKFFKEHNFETNEISHVWKMDDEGNRIEKIYSRY